MSSLPTVDARSREFRLYVKRLTQTAVEIEVEIHFRGNDGTEASRFEAWPPSAVVSLETRLRFSRSVVPQQEV